MRFNNVWIQGEKISTVGRCMQCLYYFSLLRQISAGIRFLAFYKIFRLAFEYHITAILTTFRSKVYDPVGAFYNLLVMLYQDHRMTMINKSIY